MTPVVASGAVLAVNNFGDVRTGALAGPLGLVIILGLLVVTFLLVRNMSARIKRLPSNFDTTSGDDQSTSADPERETAAGGPDKPEATGRS